MLSYVILNKRAPFRPSSLLIPIFGAKVVGTKLATAFDALSAFAILGAVAGHMGYGSMQIAWTTKLIFGLEPSMLLYMGIIAILFAGDILTAAKGLQKGIAKLSDINTDLFFALLLFVFLAGPSTYIINLFLHSTSEYLNNFLANSLYTAPFLDSGNWAQSWDMYWLIDWMAFAPLLGLFMVRVSYGRSVREYIMIEWILPALFGMVWFSIFGGTALHEQLTGAFDYWAVYLSEGAEALTMTLLGNLPFGKIIQVVVLVVLLISLITQGNSMILSLIGMVTSYPMTPPTTLITLFIIIAISQIMIIIDTITSPSTFRTNIFITFVGELCFCFLRGFAFFPLPQYIHSMLSPLLKMVCHKALFSSQWLSDVICNTPIRKYLLSFLYHPS